MNIEDERTAELRDYDVAVTMCRRAADGSEERRTFQLRIPAVSAEKARAAAGSSGIAWGINEATGHQWKSFEGSITANVADTIAGDAQADDRTAAELARLAADLRLDPARIARYAIGKHVSAARARRERSLRDVEDHSRITGWDVDGSPILR